MDVFIGCLMVFTGLTNAFNVCMMPFKACMETFKDCMEVLSECFRAFLGGCQWVMIKAPLPSPSPQERGEVIF